jgi:hypothetical protein
VIIYPRDNLKKVSLATIALVLLATTLLATPLTQVAGATASPSDPNAVIYAHFDSRVSLNGGIVGNTTQKFHSSAQTTVDTTASSTSQMIWSFNMYPGLASGVTVPASKSFSVVLYINANTSLSGVTVGAQVNMYCGSDSSPWGGEVATTQSLTTAVTPYTITISTGSSAVNVASGCSFHTIAYVQPGTTRHETITISYDSSSTPTRVSVPLNEWKSVSITNSVPSVATDTDMVTASVSDAFGLYDLVSVTFTAASPRGNTVSGASMSQVSGTPTSSTGSYSYALTPFNTVDQGWPGTWMLYATLTDQSGNTLQSPSINLIYDFGGYGQTTTNQPGVSVGGRTFSFSNPILDVMVILLVALVVVGIAHKARRKR